MRYDLFVNSPRREHDDLVQETFPDKKIYFPSTYCREQDLKNLGNSKVIISYIDPKQQSNQMSDIKIFHRRYAHGSDRKLENVITIISPDTILDSYRETTFNSLGYLEPDLETALNRAEKYLEYEESFDKNCRKMYRQDVPFLKVFYALQTYLIDLLNLFDNLRKR